MNKATKIFAAVLVVAGVLLALFALRLGTANAPAPSATPSVVTQTLTQRFPAVVAARALAPGKPITADDVKIAQFDSAAPGAFNVPADVVGRVPLVALAAGVPVTQNLLAHGLAMQLAPGERAVSLPVTETVGVSNRIRPGDFVDVFFTMKTNQPAGSPAVGLADDTQARLLASRVRVLTYGNASLDDVTPPPAAPSVASTVAAAAASQPQATQPPMSAQPPMPATSAVVAVPIEDVNRLVLGAQQGKITLALRNPTDDAKPDTSLFPPPPPVLVSKAALTGDTKASLDTPENRAYAGIATTGLAGEAPRRAPMGASRAAHGGGGSSGGTVEVVRGAERSTAAY